MCQWSRADASFGNHRSSVLANEGFHQRMMRKRSNFDIDTSIDMPEDAYKMLFIHSGLAEPNPGALFHPSAQIASGLHVILLCPLGPSHDFRVAIVRIVAGVLLPKCDVALISRSNLPWSCSKAKGDHVVAL